MSSADAGVGTILTLPDKFGQIYGLVANGSGYNHYDTDRFKDPAVRLTITPLANSGVKLLSTWAISPCYYKGEVASKFVASALPPATNGPVDAGLNRKRYGIFTGIRDSRLTLGAHYVQFKGQGETRLNTQASPRAVVDATGHAYSLYGWLRPLAFVDSAATRLGLVARYDRVTTNTDTDARYHVFIGGLTLDLNKRAALSFDYQEQLSENSPVINGATITPSPPLKTWFAHLVANF